MCGICGKLVFDRDATVSRPVLESMTDAIRHRGPDDDGFHISGQIGLGFRRLSIIDLSTGHQPIANEDGTVWIVFNGEIYNYQQLREDLIANGHIFKTKTDTEVIVHLYEDYGPNCVKKLRGMFGFAIWDETKKTLLLARDRVGIKPLYYCVDRAFFSFGSEIKAMLADPAVSRDVDPSVIDSFLTYYYVPGDRTLFRNIFKLEPGHTITVTAGGKTEVRRYWDLDFTPSSARRTQVDLEHELLELLDETVRLHMISDVPVGFLLSGGLDSTAMLSLACRKTDVPISTFTLGFSSDTVVDERPFARLAAARFGSKHYEITISPEEFRTFLPGYVWYMEEPVCQPPAINLYYVSKLASEHVKVLISGEGGDEAFAGYENYRNNFWFEKAKKACGPLGGVIGTGMSLLGHATDSRVLTKYGARMGMSLEQYYLSRTSTPFSYFNREPLTYYSREMASRIDKTESMSAARRHMTNASGFGLLDRMLYVDTKTWLPDDLLVKADKMTMANSVELRVPFLDHKVLEFAAALPRNQKVRGWTMKYLARKALKTRVPREIIDRKKAGFPVPVNSWLQRDLRDWVRGILLDRRSLERGYFQPSAIERLVRENRTANSQDIFSLVVLELWHRAFVDHDVLSAVGVH
jgi:asparagine synthase (glutamine-hydrolysing)